MPPRLPARCAKGTSSPATNKLPRPITVSPFCHTAAHWRFERHATMLVQQDLEGTEFGCGSGSKSRRGARSLSPPDRHHRHGHFAHHDKSPELSVLAMLFNQLCCRAPMLRSAVIA